MTSWDLIRNAKGAAGQRRVENQIRIGPDFRPIQGLRMPCDRYAIVITMHSPGWTNVIALIVEQMEPLTSITIPNTSVAFVDWLCNRQKSTVPAK